MAGLRPAELDKRLSAGDRPFLLDIRPEADYSEDAIEDSHNVPVYDDLRSGTEATFRDRLGEMPADRDIVVVCKMGIVAKRATRVLEDEGYEAATLAGGMSGWNGYLHGTLGYRLRSLVWRLF
ncbi:MAG: rhodanese-like domain-containing protein [Haloarculaceae archaeon]